MEYGTYRVVINGEEQNTDTPGEYAGWRAGKIFGTLDCKSGMRMKRESRLFFASIGEAILLGYRPCKNCQPLKQSDFDAHSDIIEQTTLSDFYNRDNRR